MPCLPTSFSARPPVDPDLCRTVERLVDQFTQAWINGPPPRLETFLARVPGDLRTPLLEELLLLELELRTGAGQAPVLADYTGRFPDDAGTLARAFTQFQGLAAELGHLEPDSQPRTPAASPPSLVPLPLRELARRLRDLDLVPLDLLREQLAAPPASARDLARRLVHAQLLTRFQAEMLLRGAGDRLQIGNYLLDEPLGAGGMGQVYRGRHRRLQQPVAIKVLSPELCWNKTAIRRFEREVRLASRVSHPNLVTALDAEEQQGRWFLVMELVPGQDLSKLVRQKGPLPVEQAVDCICQVAQGLQSAHDQGILHRDIKPGNLLLSETGQVKVLDLGLAIALSGNSPDPNAEHTTSQITGTGVGLGTIDYMSPEQAADARQVDERSDLYSLGCTLFFLLTGRPPYRGANAVERLVAHSTAPIPSLRDHRPDVPPALDELFARLVAKSPRQRYASCADLLIDLRRLQALGLSQTAAPAEAPHGSTTRPSAPQGLAPLDAHWANLTLDSAPVRVRNARSATRDTASGRKPLWGMLTCATLLLAAVLWWLFGRPAPATLALEVSPDDAFVELVNDRGSVVARGAAQRGRLSLQAPPGAYQVRISQDQFQPQEFAVRLAAGKGSRGRFALTAPNASPEDEPEPEPEDLTLWFHSREFDDWNRQLRLEPADQQYQRINQKLRELNPEMYGTLEVHHHPSHTQLMLNSDKVRDLSPLRALKDNPTLARAQELFLHKDVQSRGLLQDLSPLRGLKLRFLRLRDCQQIRDLSPLRNMPLETLDIGNTQVEHLDPLSTCGQLKTLSMALTRILSLEPLRDLQLEVLNLEESLFNDLTPLANMTSLRELNVWKCREIRSLHPLARIYLSKLIFARSGVDSLDDLNVQRLEHLDATLTSITNLNRLREARQLKYLDLRETSIRDLSPLIDLPVLHTLHVSISGNPQDPLLDQVRHLKHLQFFNDKPWPR